MSDISEKISSRKKILVAEDRDELRELLRITCELAGHDVYDAEDGVTALDIYQQCPLDLIITDFEMPHMDGMQLLENIRARGNGVPVVLVSGNRLDRHEIISKGFVDYLQKPYSPWQIMDCIARYVKK
ncbi:MAG: response regulator [Candidatus Woesearchaeota archaeon]